METYKIFGSEMSLFGEGRAYLRFKKIPHEWILPLKRIG